MFPVDFAVLGTSSETYLRKNMAIHWASRQFDWAYFKSRMTKFWGAITRHSPRMLTLAKIRAAVSIRTYHYKGVQTVPLDCIRGSENRYADFDIRFNPLHWHDKNRWVNVAAAMFLERSLPPVELIQIGCIYFVRDGHHRISVARALGQKDIDAVVLAWEVNGDICQEDFS